MSWTASPIQTPSKARRSYQSEYETAGEEDDSDSSMYYSMTDMDRTLENKENSMKMIPKSTKRLAAARPGTPLLRKTLQKNLIEIQASMTPRENDTQAPSDVTPDDSQPDNICQVNSNTASPPKDAVEANTKIEVDGDDNASGMTDDACNVTVLETGIAPAVEPPANTQRIVSFRNVPVKVVVTDFDEPNKRPIEMVTVTKKTNRTPNGNAAVRSLRQQLAEETRKMPTQMGRISVYKRSSMYQPRKSATRRSIESMIVAKVNKALLETEVAFADDVPTDSKPTDAISSTADSQPAASSASMQNTKSGDKPAEPAKKIAAKEFKPIKKTKVASNIAQGKYDTRLHSFAAMEVDPFRKPVMCYLIQSSINTFVRFPCSRFRRQNITYRLTIKLQCMPNRSSFLVQSRRSRHLRILIESIISFGRWKCLQCDRKIWN